LRDIRYVRIVQVKETKSDQSLKVVVDQRKLLDKID